MKMKLKVVHLWLSKRGLHHHIMPRPWGAKALSLPPVVTCHLLPSLISDSSIHSVRRIECCNPLINFSAAFPWSMGLHMYVSAE